MTVTEANAVKAMSVSALLPSALVDANLLENLQGQRDAALAQVAANDAAVATLKTEQDATLQAAADANAAEIAALTATNAQAVIDATTPLQATITTLTAQIAGTRGDYKITVDAVQQIALDIEAESLGQTVEEYLAASSYGLLVGLATKHEETIFAQALPRFAAAPPDQQLQVLTALGLTAYAALPPDALMQVLGAFALPAFKALDGPTQTQLLVALGLAS